LQLQLHWWPSGQDWEYVLFPHVVEQLPAKAICGNAVAKATPASIFTKRLNTSRRDVIFAASTIGSAEVLVAYVTICISHKIVKVTDIATVGKISVVDMRKAIKVMDQLTVIVTNALRMQYGQRPMLIIKFENAFESMDIVHLLK
jgi:hypothetical protein